MPANKPTLSTSIYLLGGLVVIGLAALGIAAYTAFLQVAPWYQALFAAALIEASMVAEAIAIVRKNWFAIPGVIISLLVSGTYNYIQAEQTGRIHGLTDGWQLLTLAIGPLSALFFLALSLGYEMRRHDREVDDWRGQMDQAQQHQEQTALEIRQLELAEQRKTQLEMEAASADARRLELAEQRKTEVALERLRLREERKTRGDMSLTPVTYPVTGVTRGTYDTFAMAQRGRNGAGVMSIAEITQNYGVSSRTAIRWRNQYRGDQPDDQTS
jgi:hypothetical protein